MSYTELQSGKITVIGKFTPGVLDEYMIEIVKKRLPYTYGQIKECGQFPSWCNCWLDVFNFYIDDNERYIYVKSTLFKVSDVKNHDDQRFFFDAVKISDDEYRFVTQYYNGGTCLSEILEKEVNNIANDL